jgi:hypothetical protein
MGLGMSEGDWLWCRCGEPELWGEYLRRSWGLLASPHHPANLRDYGRLAKACHAIQVTYVGTSHTHTQTELIDGMGLTGGLGWGVLCCRRWGRRRGGPGGGGAAKPLRHTTTTTPPGQQHSHPLYPYERQ